MSHDRWRDQLHDAGADAARLAALFESGIPSNGLQLAGSAVLATTASTNLTVAIGDLAAALRQRGWIGDTELAVALIDHNEQQASELFRSGWISAISRTSSISRRVASRISISSPAPSGRVNS